MYRDYAPKGVKFYYVYKTLAHPETNRYVNPFSLEERLLHVREAKDTLGTEVPWLCDNMTNDLRHDLARGGVNNPEFIFDPEGKIVVMRDWSKPELLREDLQRLVGPVERPTTVADLDLNVKRYRPEIPTGVVPGVEVPGRMRPLTSDPQTTLDTTYYAKLRAEADEPLLETGSGTLYLGFHLDPLYRVHWNNLAEPLEFALTAGEGVKLTPAQGTAPEVDVPSDLDPREFLVEVSGAKPGDRFELTVRYFACSDEQGWCKPVTQKYKIHLEHNRDLGVVMAREMRFGRGNRRLGGRFNFVERIMRNDRNGDGKVTKEELPDFLQRMFDRIDANGDGVIGESEAEKMSERFRSRGGRGQRNSRPQRQGRPNRDADDLD